MYFLAPKIVNSQTEIRYFRLLISSKILIIITILNNRIFSQFFAVKMVFWSIYLLLASLCIKTGVVYSTFKLKKWTSSGRDFVVRNQFSVSLRSADFHFSGRANTCLCRWIFWLISITIFILHIFAIMSAFNVYFRTPKLSLATIKVTQTKR